MMTAPLPDHELSRLLDTYEHLEVPEGQRAELIGGEIVLSPTPATFHNFIFAHLTRVIDRGTPDSWLVSNTTTVELPASSERFIPDLLVCEAEALQHRTHWLLPADDVLLVAEITSPSTAVRDRTTKVAGYARSQVPLYLLVDPHDGEGSTTVYANPGSAGGYRDEHRVLFGESLLLPEPFELELDTSVFLKG